MSQSESIPPARALATNLKVQHERAMERYCQWRRNEPDAHRLVENAEHLQEIDRLRRQLASAEAEASDVSVRMRLLDNWSDPAEAGVLCEYSTAQGSYRLEYNDVTRVWLVLTPDQAVEGPWASAQEAADWAADDWVEMFGDSENVEN